MSLFGKIIGVFTSPGNAFQAIAAKPQWLPALLISLVITMGNMFFMQPVMLKEQAIKTQEKMQERNMDQDQIDQTLEKTQKIAKIAMYPTTIIGVFIMVLIAGGIWLFVSNTILGGEAKYKQMLGVIAFSGFIPLLGSIIKTPIMIAQQTTNVHFSLATFMSDELVDTFLYKFLAQIEFFTIWSLIVTCIGIAVVAKLSVKKVWPWVVMLSLLFMVGSAWLGSAFAG